MSASSNPKESIWRRFWIALGGWSTLLNDVYLYAALALTIVSLPLWLQPLWWDTTINVLAILIGFSVSGFAVALSVVDRLGGRELKRSRYDNTSPLLKLIAGYVHYLIVGITALGFSVLCKAWYFPNWVEVARTKAEWEFFLTVMAISAIILWVFGGFLFCYSLTSAVRNVMSIFRLIHLVQRVHDHAASKSQSPPPRQPESPSQVDEAR